MPMPFLRNILVLCVSIALAYPQASTSTLSGVVRDQTNAVISGAKVALSNTETNFRFETVTNSSGFYVFPSINPGPYKLEATQAGMDKYEASVLVQVAQKITVDPLLKPGNITNTITVTDATPMVNVTDSTVSKVINKAQVEQLPRGDRTLLNLMVTVPGVEGGGRRASGLRYGSAEFQLDGSPMVSRSRGEIQYRQPGLDSIEEVSVDSNNVSAKYNSPVAVIASTKSGTNELHGSLFETHVNSRVGGARTRDASNALAPYSNRGQYGGSIGGPVVLPRIYNGKNRTFFFFAYEGTRRLSNALVNFSIPTVAMRNGDFSGLKDAAGRLLTLYDPNTTDSKTFARQPFNFGGKANAIDPARMSPLWKYVMNLTPMPTLPDVNPLIASNWFGNVPTIQKDWTASTRVDHRFSDRDVMYVRYSKNYILSDSPFAGSIPLNTSAANRNAFTAPGYSTAASWVHTLSPTLFNEVLLTQYRQGFYQNSDPLSSQDWDSQLGLPNPLGAKQWPDILSFGLNGTLYRTVYPNADKSVFYQVQDNVTKIAGKHQLMAGFHFRRDLINYLPQQEQSAGLTNPVANWTAAWDPTGTIASPRVLPQTGSPVGSSFLGQMMYGYKTTHGYFYERENQYALYFQDNYKVTRRLTLNLGVRWSAWPAMKEKYDNISGFDLDKHAIVLTQPLDAYYKLNQAMAPGIDKLKSLGVKFIDYKEAGLPRSLLSSNWKDFAPRAGFAFRLTDGGRPLVVRGGYALTYFPVVMQSQLEKMRAAIPFVSNPIYSPDSTGFSPDGLAAYSLRNKPTYVAGLNTRDVLSSAAGVSGLNAGSLTGALTDPNNPDTRVHDWNLTVEKEVLPKTLARVALVGNHTSYLDGFRSLNPQASQYTWAVNTGLAYPNNAGASRPYDPLYGDIIATGKYGYANYSGMQFEVARRHANGFSYQVFYVVNNAFTLTDGSNQSTITTFLPASSYLASQVNGLNQNQLDRLTNYKRDITIPKRRLSWNWVADAPIGRGKKFGAGMNKWLDMAVGGWQLSGIGTWNTTWFTLPSDQFPTATKFETYGQKYSVRDCRSGRCLSAFLYYNAYINPAQINSVDAKGNPNGIMGVPDGYKPAFQNLIPFPEKPVANDPNAPFYGTNTVLVGLKDGTAFRGAYGGILPLQNQYVETPGLWTLSTSLFKSFAIKERVRMRVQWDVFNPTNSPQEPQTPNTSGLIYTYLNGTAARSMQFSLRLLW